MMGNEAVSGIGFETGYCQFCGYAVETKPYPDGDQPEIWLCEFCEQLSRNDRKNRDLRVINWGFNHLLKNQPSETPPNARSQGGQGKTIG
jgi:hypothetical protein